MSDAERCVQCRQRPVEPRWRPFCSERCRMVDLGRWLSGEYRVTGQDGVAPPAGHPARPGDTDDQ